MMVTLGAEQVRDCSVETLLLAGQHAKAVDATHFKRLTKLKNVDLSHNSLVSVILPCAQLIKVDLSNNNLRECPKIQSHKLESLKLDGNGKLTMYDMLTLSEQHPKLVYLEDGDGVEQEVSQLRTTASKLTKRAEKTMEEQVLLAWKTSKNSLKEFKKIMRSRFPKDETPLNKFLKKKMNAYLDNVMQSQPLCEKCDFVTKTVEEYQRHCSLSSHKSRVSPVKPARYKGRESPTKVKQPVRSETTHAPSSKRHKKLLGERTDKFAFNDDSQDDKKDVYQFSEAQEDHARNAPLTPTKTTSLLSKVRVRSPKKKPIRDQVQAVTKVSKMLGTPQRSEKLSKSLPTKLSAPKEATFDPELVEISLPSRATRNSTARKQTVADDKPSKPQKRAERKTKEVVKVSKLAKKTKKEKKIRKPFREPIGKAPKVSPDVLLEKDDGEEEDEDIHKDEASCRLSTREREGRITKRKKSKRAMGETEVDGDDEGGNHENVASSKHQRKGRTSRRKMSKRDMGDTEEDAGDEEDGDGGNHLKDTSSSKVSTRERKGRTSKRKMSKPNVREAKDPLQLKVKDASSTTQTPRDTSRKRKNPASPDHLVNAPQPNAREIENLKDWELRLEHLIRTHGPHNSSATHAETEVWACAFGPKLSTVDCRGVLASVGGNCVCFTDVGIGKVLAKYTHEGEDFYSLAWGVLNSCPIVAAAGLNGDVKLIDFEQKTCFKQLEGHTDMVLALAFHPDPTTPWLLSSSSDSTIILWDVKARTKLKTFKLPSAAESIAFSFDGSGFIAGLGNGCVARGGLDSKGKATISGYHKLHKDIVDCVKYVTNDLVASKCAGDDAIRFWLPTSKKSAKNNFEEILKLPIPPVKQYCLRFEVKESQDGYLVIYGDGEGCLKCWHLRLSDNRKELLLQDTLSVPAKGGDTCAYVRGIAWTHDLNHFAAALSSNLVEIWSAHKSSETQ